MKTDKNRNMATGDFFINRAFTTDNHNEDEESNPTSGCHGTDGCRQTADDTAIEKQEEKSKSEGAADEGTNWGRSWRNVILFNRWGLLLAVVAAFIFAVKNMFLHYLTTTIDPFQSVAMVKLMVMLCSLSVLAVKKVPVPKTRQQIIWLFLGAVPFALSFTAFTVSVSFINVADVTTIAYSSLMFVGVLSWIVLKEKLYVFDFVFAFISLTGVLCIARPPFIFGNEGDGANDEQSKDLIIGVCTSLLTSFFSALSYVTIRKQSKYNIHAFTTVCCSAIIGILINSIICSALMTWRIPSLNEWLFTLGAGCSQFTAAATMAMSLSIETATLVNIFLTAEIAFTFLFQFLVLNVTPHWTSLIGATLVVIACIGISVKKRPAERA